MISLSNRYIFVPNMKCACSAMKAFLEPVNSMKFQGHFKACDLKNGTLGERFERGVAARGDEILEIDFSKNWDDFFTFGFVRNPWDHFLSWYAYMERELNVEFSFEAFVMEEAGWGSTVRFWDFKGLFDRVSEDGELIVDFVGKFENLNDDWKVVCESAGIPYTPLAKINATKERRHYSTYYTDEMVEKVRILYGRDCEAFDYSFDDQR